MERNDQRHMDEELNLRSFYLRLIKKIWLIPLLAVIGALLAAGIYTLVTVTFGPEKTYYTESSCILSSPMMNRQNLRWITITHLRGVCL